MFDSQADTTVDTVSKLPADPGEGRSLNDARDGDALSGPITGRDNGDTPQRTAGNNGESQLQNDNRRHTAFLDTQERQLSIDDHCSRALLGPHTADRDLFPDDSPQSPVLIDLPRESHEQPVRHAHLALSGDIASRAPTDPREKDAGLSREGHEPLADRYRDALPGTIDDLIAYQRTRRFCIRSQSRIDRSSEAFAARLLGFGPTTPKPEADVIWARVSAFRKRIEKTIKKGSRAVVDSQDRTAPESRESREIVADQQTAALSAAVPIFVESYRSRECWDTMRDTTEKLMRKAARTLPAWSWGEAVKGFGDLGLGIIVGEAGNLSNYATKERLWKRLGLAVIEGIRQQKRTDPELAKVHGYSPKRRSEIWTIADSMFKHQWAGDKDEDGKNPARTGKPVVTPAHPTGEYGAVYMVRKAKTEYTDWTLMHREQDARRIMTKALIADLWLAWKLLSPSYNQGGETE